MTTRVLRPAALPAATIALSLGEAVAARAGGFSGALAPQVAAPAPYAVFHDLRWLLVAPVPLAAFGALVVAVCAVRSLLSAALLQAAWPADTRRPPFARTWRMAAVHTVVCAVLVAPSAALMYGVGVASVSWLAFAAVPSVLAVAMFVLAGGAALPQWYAEHPPARAVVTAVAGFAAYSLAGAAIVAVPGWAAVPVAAAAGGLDAWLWRALATMAAGHARRRPRWPVTTAGLAGFTAVFVVGTTIGFHVTRLHPQLRAAAEMPAPQGQPVVVASGFGTPWDGHAPHYLGAGFTEWQYSYAGLDRRGLPRPFLGPQTYAPLPVLVQRMAAEVAQVHRRTGRPVDLVAESEGALVAEAYLEATPDAPVGRVVLLSPLVEPGRLRYPTATSGDGSAAAALGLRALSRAAHGLGSEQISGDNPVLRSIVEHGPDVSGMLACPAPGGAPTLLVLPIADATSTRYGAPLAAQTAVVAGFHGGLLAYPGIDRMMAGWLRAGTAPGTPVLGAARPAVQALSAAWQVPSRAPVAGSCAARAARLRGWLTG